MDKLISASAVLIATIIGLTAGSDAFPQTHQCREVMVAMRDDVQLATDVYLPSEQEGPFPVIVRRTPYDKRDCEEPEAIYFADNGYAVVNQDERGRYNSNGEYYWYRIFANDGYDTIEWAATQAWSNDKVGTLGTSFMCVNQYTMLPSNPPHLAAAFCSMGAANPYKYAFYQGGALQMIMPSWLMLTNELVTKKLDQPTSRGYAGTSELWLQWYRSKQEHQLSIGRAMLSEMMRDMIANPYYNDYWRQFAADENTHNIDVPVFHFASTYDRYPLSQVRMFNLIREHGGNKARDSQKLLLGPWVHGLWPVGPTTIGELDFGPEAAIDYRALQKRWFDYHLKGIENGIMDEPPVRVFVMGKNHWRQGNEFPLARTIHTDYFLRAGPSGSIDSLNDGLLLRQKPVAGEPPASYRYDPLNPTPTIGGDHFIQPNGARDHRPADLISLTYTTPILEEDVEVIGMPLLELYAASSAVDTDWVVTISDVHPDGYSQHLRQNLLRARFRDGWEQPAFLTPGEVYKFVIDMYPISNVFLKGHRIRVTLASSSFPKWYPNGNTGGEMNDETTGIIATNTIYHEPGRPSRIILPVIPSEPSR